ncbi:MAG: GDSL-type esterase/lipase family protein [Chloroflexota bacterium]|nr:GDSL-type esterase/lipase family protein [Chloroflexota bacterium]
MSQPLLDAPVAVPLVVTAPARRPSRLHRLVQGLAVLLITIAMTLILLEIALRLFAPQLQVAVNPALFMSDAETKVRNAPGVTIQHDTPEFHVTYQINAQGLRADGPTGAPAPNRLRLLAVGDSFTFGWGVEGNQAFPQRLDGVRAADGRTVESLNAGVATYGTDHEAAWLHKYGWGFQPNVVLLGFYTGNDVQDVMRYIGQARPATAATRQAAAAVAAARARLHDENQSDAESWLEANSNAYVFLQQQANRFLPGPRRAPDMLDTTYPYLNPPPAELTTAWERTTALLDQMQNQAQRYHVRLVVVAIPAAEQIEDGRWTGLRATFGLAPDAVNRDAPQQQLAAWSVRSGVPVIDLLPGFRAAGGSRLYYRADPHWTPAGHALAADLIRAELARLGVLAAAP